MCTVLYCIIIQDSTVHKKGFNMAVTKHTVIDAIEQLEAQGASVTNANILEITGGSNATVQKYRREYYNGRQAQIAKASIVLQDNETKLLTDAFATLLKQRVSTVQERYDADITQLNTALAEASLRIDELAQAIDAQNIVNREATAQATQAVNEKATLQAHYESERKQMQAEINRLNELAFTQKGRADLLEERIKQFENNAKT